MAAIAGGAVTVSPDGALDAVRFQLDRPVQIESSPAMVVLGLDAVGAGHAESVKSFRSDGLLHPASDAVTSLFLTALVALVALLCVRAASGRPGGGDPMRGLVLASLAACAGFAMFGKVFSPQFVTWVLPLGALAFAWRMHAGARGRTRRRPDAGRVPRALLRRGRPRAAGDRRGGAPERRPGRRDRPDPPRAACAASCTCPRARLAASQTLDHPPKGSDPSSGFGRQQQLLDAGRAALRVRLDQHAVQPRVLVGGLEADFVIVRKRSSASSRFTPITPPRGPVIPTSVM